MDATCVAPLCSSRVEIEVFPAWGLCEYHAMEVASTLAPTVREWMQSGEDARLARLEATIAACPPVRTGEQVYYLRRGSDRAVKIGYTINLATRLAQLRKRFGALELLALHSGGREAESALHEAFRHLRIGRTEWFRLAPDLLTHIAGLRVDLEACT